MNADLIDRIYECAFIPEQWPSLLDELARIVDARGGVFFVERNMRLRGTSSAAMADVFGAFLEGDFFRRSLRTPRAFDANIQGFIRDIWTESELAQDPLYSELLWPAGLGWCAATVIVAPTGDNLVITIERERNKGPVDDATIDRLNPLRPHLARASLYAARLQLELARAATRTLALLGMPALVFDHSGKAVAVNDLLQQDTQTIRWHSGDRFTLVDRRADRHLQEAIARFAGNATAPVSSFALRDEDGIPAMIAHIVPITLNARDIFSRCSGMLMLTPVAMAEAPPIELVQSLFDLSPAEARVARNLTAGANATEIARCNGVSLATVRTQVRAVLEKTGCHRQSEVVSLLGGHLAPIRQ